jgi:hypothetical protein
MVKPSYQASMRALSNSPPPCRRRNLDSDSMFDSVISDSSSLQAASTAGICMSVSTSSRSSTTESIIDSSSISGTETRSSDDTYEVDDVDIEDLDDVSVASDSTQTEQLVELEAIGEDVNVECDNILVDRDALLKLFCQGFNCRYCEEETTVADFKFVTVGIATSINFLCNNCSTTKSCKAIKCTTRLSRNLTRSASHKFSYPQEPANIAIYDFDINRKFIMSMQAIGQGGSSAATISAFLGLNVGGFNTKWTGMEKLIAVEEVQLGKNVVRDNLQEEIRLSPTRVVYKKLPDGVFGPLQKIERPLLTVMMDCGWIKRSRSYDSAQGHHVTVGGHGKKCISLQLFNKVCIRCQTDSCHLIEFCANPQQFNGSSKAMEGKGAMLAARELLDACCWIGTFVSDDDSSQHSLMKRRLVDLYNNNDIVYDDLYETKVSKKGVERKVKKTDLGIIPYDNGDVDQLADPNHRVRAMGKQIYGLVKKGVAISTCEKSDAERLKRNMAWCIRSNRDKPFKEFVESFNAVLEHHFNSHKYCDSKWCGPTRKDKSKKRYYRSKRSDRKLYKQLKELMEPFLTEHSLGQLYHPFNTNKCESLMANIVRLCPKNRHYSKTICGNGRVSLAVVIDSLGYFEAFKRLCQRTGMTMGRTMSEHLKRLDRRREYQRQYKSTEKYRIRRAIIRSKKLMEETQKTAKDARVGLSYKAGMAIVNQKEKEEEKKKKQIAERRKAAPKRPPKGTEEPKKCKPRKRCEHCSKYGHDNRSSSLCSRYEGSTDGAMIELLDSFDGLPVAIQKKRKKVKIT